MVAVQFHKQSENYRRLTLLLKRDYRLGPKWLPETNMREEGILPISACATNEGSCLMLGELNAGKMTYNGSL